MDVIRHTIDYEGARTSVVSFKDIDRREAGEHNVKKRYASTPLTLVHQRGALFLLYALSFGEAARYTASYA